MPYQAASSASKRLTLHLCSFFYIQAFVEQLLLYLDNHSTPVKTSLLDVLRERVINSWSWLLTQDFGGHGRSFSFAQDLRTETK